MITGTDQETGDPIVQTETTTYDNNATGPVHQTPIQLAGKNAAATAVEVTEDSETILAATATVTFPTVQYVDAGTYYYKITEDTDEGDLPPGVTARMIDENTPVAYYAKVVVPEARDDSTRATVTYYSDEACQNQLASGKDDAKFTNDQEVIDFTVTKSWTDENGTQLKDGKWIEFEVRRNGVFYPMTDQHVVLTSETGYGSYSIVNDGVHDGRVVLTSGASGWPTVKLWSLPTGTYTVTETGKTDDGETYSTTYTVGGNTTGTCPAITATDTELTINNNQGREDFTDITIEKVWMAGESRYYPTNPSSATFTLYKTKHVTETATASGVADLPVGVQNSGLQSPVHKGSNIIVSYDITFSDASQKKAFFENYNSHKLLVQYASSVSGVNFNGNASDASGDIEIPISGPENISAEERQQIATDDDSSPIVATFIVPTSGSVTTLSGGTVTITDADLQGVLIKDAQIGGGASKAFKTTSEQATTTTTDTTTTETITLTAAQHWRKTLSDLPLSSTIPATTWTYRIEEVLPTGTPFRVSYDTTNATMSGGEIIGGTVTVTNTKDTVDLTVNKVWAFGNVANYWPEGVVVTAQVFDRVIETSVDTAVQDESENDVVATLDAQHHSVVIADLPKLEDGHTYVIKEISVGHDEDHTNEDVPAAGSYYTLISGDMATGFTITNTQNLTDVTVEKTWDTVPTEDWTATFQLEKSRVAKIAENGALLATPVTQTENWQTVTDHESFTISNTDLASGSYTTTLNDLPKTETEAGAIYSLKYRVVETGLTIGSSSANRIDLNTGDYLSTLTQVGDAGNNYAIIVNNRVDDTKTSITVNKVWQGGNPPAGASVGVTIRRYKLVPDEGTLNVVDNTSIAGLLSGDSATVAYSMVPGTYDVSTGSYTITKTVTVDGDKYTPAEYTESATATVTLESAGTATFTGTPTFTRKTGTLTISDDYTGAPSGYSVSYVITGPYGYDETTSATSIPNLPTGSYTVAKTVTAPSGYVVSSNGTDSQSVDVGTDGGTATMATTTFAKQTGSIKTITFGWDNNSAYNSIRINAGIDSITIKEPLNYGTEQDVAGWTITGTQGVSITTPTYISGENSTHYMSYTISGLNTATGDSINLSISGDGMNVVTYSQSSIHVVVSPANAVVTASNANALSANSSTLSLSRGSLRKLSKGGDRALSANDTGAASGTTGQVTVTLTSLSADSNSARTPTKGDLVPQMDGTFVRNVTLNSGNSWSDVLTRLEKQDGEGHEYVYYIASVSETGVPQGTTVAITTDGAKRVVYGNEGGTLTVTDTLPKTDISARKEWDDNNDANSRPDTITYTLYVDGVAGETRTGYKSNDNDYAVTWDQLELYKADGTLHTYSVTETAVDGYTLTNTVYDQATRTFTLTNTKDQPQTGDLTVTKSLTKANTSGSALTFYAGLFADSTGTTLATLPGGQNNPKAITVANNANSSVVTFTDLPVGTTYFVFETDAEGNKVTESDKTSGYAIAANSVDGVEVVIAATGSAATITNEYSASGTGDLTATKTLTGGTLATDAFSFIATAADDNPTTGLDATSWIATPSNDVNGTVNFGSLAFSAVGTWKYMVKENVPATPAADIIYDLSEYEVTFTTTDNGDGTLTVGKTVRQVKDSEGNAISAEAQTEQSNIAVSFTNTKKGALTITKKVQYNGADATRDEQKALLNKSFTFAVKKDGDAITESPFTITVTDGLANSITIDNLEEGDYTIEETDSNGLVLTGARREDDNAGSVNNDVVTVHVTKGKNTAATVESNAKAEFTNNLPTTSVTVNKTWLVGEADYSAALADMFGTVTVQVGVFDVESSASDEILAALTASGVVQDVFGNDAKADLTASTWSATISDLPELVSGHKYYVKELSVKNDKNQDLSGYFTKSGEAMVDGGGSVTINNAPKTTTVTVSKAWSPAIPEDASATLSLYKGKSAAAATTKVTDITLDGQTGSAEAIDANDDTAGQKQKTGEWMASFTNLPKYGYDAETGVYEIAYVIKEDTVPAGYYVTYSGDNEYALNGETVTNTLHTLDIKIEKVDSETETALNGAVFKLSKFAGTNAETGSEIWNVVDNNETDEHGLFTINGNITLTGLTDGRYKLEEMSSPAGYIITSKVPVTFTINDGQVVASSNVLTTGVKYTAKADSQDDVPVDTYTIPNTPGAVLPATGGIGTTPIYAAGIALVLLALAIFLRKKYNSEAE